jgi:hypothetical protein
LEQLIQPEVAEAKDRLVNPVRADSAQRRQSSAAAELLMHLPNLGEAFDRLRALSLRDAARAAQSPDQT